MSESRNRTVTLVRGLGLVAAVSIIIGNVIGTGVFLKARVMTCNVGTPGKVLLVWVVAGLLSLAGALTYAELAAMMPRAGGEYVFVREAYGSATSFLYGWMQVFIAKTGSQASVALIFAASLNDLTGKSVEGLSAYGVQLTAVLVIVVITLLNTGAYTIAQMFPYNGRPLPAVVLVRDGGRPELIRRRDTYEDLLTNEVW